MSDTGTNETPASGQDGSGGPFPQDFGAAIVRTVVPFIAAWIVAKGAEFGLDVDSGQVTAAATTVLGSAWYVVARVLEQRWPNAGFLLGSRKQPHYEKPGA